MKRILLLTLVLGLSLMFVPQVSAEDDTEISVMERVSRNGGFLNFGFDLLEVGMNVPVKDQKIGPMYYKFGVNLRFGNFKSPVQLAVGAKIGVNFHYNDIVNLTKIESPTDILGEIKKFDLKQNIQLPIFAKLKVNLVSGDRSALYLHATGSYNINFQKMDNFVNSGSVAAGIGLAGRKTDWDIISFGHDVAVGAADNFIGDNYRIYTALSFYLAKKAKR